MNKHKILYFFVFCILLSILSLVIGLCFGAVHYPMFSMLQILTGHGQTLEKTILLQIRLPTVADAFVVGGLLSVAGVLMQALLRNPLADPYILGVSGGAAVASLIGLLIGVGILWLHIFAYAGAIIAMLLVFVLARSPKHWVPIKLLLTGVVLAAGWGAIISFILSISPNQNIQGLLFWLIGNIQTDQFSWLGLLILIVSLLISLIISKSMDILLHGEVTAKTLGVNLNYLYGIIYLLSALLTATAVSIAGTIGFVGLVIPHIVRLCIGSKHCYLLPAAMLLGGSLLTLADTLARTLMAPEQLPVGIFTVFIGVPVFLYLLLRKTSY